MDKLIQPNGLQQIAANISDLLIFVDCSWDTIPDNYFRLVSNMGLNLEFLVKEEKDLAPIRNKYFDIPARNAYPNSDPVCEFTNKTELTSHRFMSNKIIICEGQEYLSYAHFKKRLDRNTIVMDTPEYWRESDHFYIYESD